MARKFPVLPAQPHRLCWGCDLYCAADAMKCGNGSVRTPHPMELFGEDWQTWGLGAERPEPASAGPAVAPAEGRRSGL